MPSLMATAVLGSGLLGAGASIYGGSLEAGAAQSAAQQQMQAAKLAAQTQLQMFEEAKQLNLPFIQLGQQEIGPLENLLSQWPTTGNSAAFQQFLTNTPGYQFIRNQGLQAVQAGQASMGLADSGSAVKAAEQFATGLASNTYGQQFQIYEQQLQNYLNTIGLGSGSAQSLAGQGIQSRALANQYLTSGAAAGAAGTVGAANAIAGGLGGATGQLGNSALLLALTNSGMYGAGGAGGAVNSVGNLFGGGG